MRSSLAAWLFASNAILICMDCGVAALDIDVDEWTRRQADLDAKWGLEVRLLSPWPFYHFLSFFNPSFHTTHKFLGWTIIGILTIGKSLEGDVLIRGFYVQWSFSGISTFAHLPHVKCLTNQDVEFDIGIIGVPFDTAVSYRPGEFYVDSVPGLRSKYVLSSSGCGIVHGEIFLSCRPHLDITRRFSFARNKLLKCRCILMLSSA